MFYLCSFYFCGFFWKFYGFFGNYKKFEIVNGIKLLYCFIFDCRYVDVIENVVDFGYVDSG